MQGGGVSVPVGERGILPVYEFQHSAFQLDSHGAVRRVAETVGILVGIPLKIEQHS